MDRKTQLHVWYFIIAVFVVLIAQDYWKQSRETEPIPYSEFERHVEDGTIDDVVIGAQYITGTFTSPQDGKIRFVTTRVEPGLAERLTGRGIEFTGSVEDNFLRNVLSWVIPILLVFAIWIFIFRRIADRQGFGGLMSVGKSKAKIYVETDTRVSFQDVAGVDEAKEELQEIVEFLKDPESYSKLGARMPKGVLLIGPPGTGKTLLARAVAGEAGVPFFSINGSEFVEMFVGVGAARVRDLFEEARTKAPAIIFIDELDALGQVRGAYRGMGGHDEREQTLNQLLSELDGFDPSHGLVLLSATNRPEILDPALLRAGRFDRQVLVDRPDKTGRIAILKVHLKQAQLGTDVNPEKIAALTTGFSGADLANLVNEAALLATRRDAPAVEMDDFTRAIERIVAGLEKKNRLLNEHERTVVAHHEMGHALTALALPGVDTIHKVSIIPRGIGALGYTIQRPTEERFLMTKGELENKIAVLLGGRAAEQLCFEQLSTGAADDLAKATDIARAMVTRYGMTENLGYVSYENDRGTFLGGPDARPFGEKGFSEETARRIDDEVREIIHTVYERTYSILDANRVVLERCSDALLDKETIEEDELRTIATGLTRYPGHGGKKPGTRTGTAD